MHIIGQANSCVSDQTSRVERRIDIQQANGCVCISDTNKQCIIFVAHVQLRGWLEIQRDPTENHSKSRRVLLSVVAG